jgi:4-hydroxybenzoate polyprenyltransferase
LAGGALLAGGTAARGLDLILLTRLLAPALILAIFITAREMLKTLEDLPGDRAAGKQTLAARHGPAAVPRIVALLAWLLTAVVLASSLRLGFSAAYVTLAILGVLLPLHAAAVDLIHCPDPARARCWLVVLKGSYAAGILALWVA